MPDSSALLVTTPVGGVGQIKPHHASLGMAGVGDSRHIKCLPGVVVDPAQQHQGNGTPLPVQYRFKVSGAQAGFARARLQGPAQLTTVEARSSRLRPDARSRDILRQFLVEAAVLCWLGGILGIVLGRVGSSVISAWKGWPTAVSLPAILGAVGVSLLVGLTFGYYPAWKASRLDPIEALRYE